jgi:outer membrane protein TolC
MPNFISLRRRAPAIALLAFVASVPRAGAQAPAPLTISLDDALRMAAAVSHTVRAAEAGVLRARGQQSQARAQYFPQLSASAGYQRTLQSQFQEIQKREPAGGSGGSNGSGDSSSSNSFGSIGKIFASPVTETITLNFSQNLFTGGRVEAAIAGARAARTAADIGFDAARAQMTLDVAQAYFDAVAASRLADIADSTLAQTERSLQNTSLAYEVGTASEFDLLRARVARDNQRPAVIQAKGNRDVALLRLRQLLGVPLSQPIALSTPIRDDGRVGESRAVSANAAGVALDRPMQIPGTERALTPDTAVARRSTVRIAEANVHAQQAAVRAASWQRLPSFQVTSTYQRFGYPPSGAFAPNSFGLFYPNWTVTAGFSFPLFTGGRIGGDRLVAEANLDEARENLAQAREAAELDARTAVTLLEQAEAAYAASVGTDEQAAKAYAIAEVRQREGISTEVELQQSRTQYEQARLNRVLAARDLEVARLRVALLKDLPVAARR